MKNIEVSDEVSAALQRLATELHCTTEEVLALLMKVPAASPEAAEPLAAFVLQPEFRAKPTGDEKYFALLSWVSARHPAEFGEFLRSETGTRRFLGMSREEILETCRHNQARHIDGTQYWAIMNIETETKRRFLARVLEFIGYRDEVIEFACNAFASRNPARRFRFAA